MAPGKLYPLLLLVTVACYSDRTVGVSNRNEPKEVAPAKPKFPSVIVAQTRENLNLQSPRVGDMDGDGFDDFVLIAEPVQEDGQPGRPLLYLFYGKAEWPAQLSTADADAAFEIDAGFNGGVGDLNGDGFSDLLLTHYSSANFVFGSKQRVQGRIARGTGGVTWNSGGLPAPFSPELLIQFSVRGAGDLDGDGCADLIVRATATLNVEGELADRAWVALGHRGEWQSGEWDARSAAAEFGYGSSTTEWDFGTNVTLLDAEGAGDLDGDGRDDLLAPSGSASLVYYGKREYPAELSVAEADARLLPSAAVRDEVGAASMELNFTPPVLFGQRFGDLDSDGNDDLPVLSFDRSFRIMYGRRWSGESEIKADLVILPEHPSTQSVMNAAAGDIDGDLIPDLVLNVADRIDLELQDSLGVAVVYVLRGTGERSSGLVQLSADDRWTIPVKYLTSGAPPGAGVFNLLLAGDIDGDGSQEILTNLVPTDPFGSGPIYLIPSTPRAPD